MVVATNEILFAYEECTASCLQTRSKTSGNTPFSAETNNKSLDENTKCVKREHKTLQNECRRQTTIEDLRTFYCCYSLSRRN
jgi:hypothetical protein